VRVRVRSLLSSHCLLSTVTTGGTQHSLVKEAIEDAGRDFLVAQYGTWYADLDEASQTQFSRLMTGEATPEEVAEVLQTVTDQIREDPEKPKFTREAPRTENLPIATPGATPSVATPEG